MNKHGYYICYYTPAQEIFDGIDRILFSSIFRQTNSVQVSFMAEHDDRL